MQHVSWSRNANIYEVNIRQYTPEGTLKAFAQHLPRLRQMGVDILWLMPIQPIGEKNRKGTLGSYYAVRDYMAVNPEFGTLDDLRALVRQAHGLGMHVILDWVANHTAFDNPWTQTHSDWYLKNDKGDI
jgi:glycosidase